MGTVLMCTGKKKAPKLMDTIKKNPKVKNLLKYTHYYI